LLVVRASVAPVLLFFSVTVALGITAPVGSVTVPWTFPCVMLCALSVAVNATINSAKAIEKEIVLQNFIAIKLPNLN
jgi:hypothetical protein